MEWEGREELLSNELNTRGKRSGDSALTRGLSDLGLDIRHTATGNLLEDLDNVQKDLKFYSYILDAGIYMIIGSIFLNIAAIVLAIAGFAET